MVTVAGIRASRDTGSQPSASESHATADGAVVTPSPPPLVDERPARATTQIRDVLVAFSAWSATHAGAPCPSGDELSKDAVDPWGHRLVITCTGQPEGQQIGVISLGPDGQLRTTDDLTSWQLDAELVGGARWVTAPVAVPAAAVAAPTAPLIRRPVAKAPPKPIVVREQSPAAAAPAPTVTIAPALDAPAPPPPTPPPSTPLIGSDGVIRKR